MFCACGLPRARIVSPRTQAEPVARNEDCVAERAGDGDGRVYTITVRCTDGTSGLSSTATTAVTVAHKE